MCTNITILRTKAMLDIFRPIQEKIDKLESFEVLAKNHTTLKTKDVCDTLEHIYLQVLQLSQCSELRQEDQAYIRFKKSLDDFRAAIENIQMREDLDNTAQINIHQATRNLAESVIEMLYSEDCLIIEKIRRLLSICCNTLDKLQYVNDVNIISNVKDFINATSDCKKLLMNRAINLNSKKHKNLILLCMNQIQKCIVLLLNTFGREGWTSNATSYKESVRYLHTRLKWCFSELLCVIEAPVPLESEEAEDCGGIFVQRMDQALEILASMKVDEEFHDLIPVVKEVVEDLLCHAMAIAQVSISKDSTNITHCCQEVLHCLENIKKELPSASVHTSIRQSLSFALADALETLEQQVNNGVLRLVLEVFYDPCSPLKELLKKLALSSVDPQAEDLDNQIVVLDLHVDRIMQIGMFAMACSSDVKRILGIRSCLASLESLEPELVPAITAHYIDYNQSTHRNYVKMLSCHWQKEVIDLEKLIDGIVDPAAFCQITYEDVHGLVMKLKSSLNSEKHTLKSLVDKVCKKSSKLVRHLLISVPEMEPLATELSIPHAIEELNRACEECSAAINLVFSNESASLTFTQLLKRCKLIVSLMKKLQPSLLTLMNHTQPLKEVMGMKFSDVYNTKKEETLLFPNSVKDLPLDISHSNTEDGRNSEGDFGMKSLNLGNIQLNKGLQPFFEKGKKLCQERSILYQTPKSAKKPCLKLSAVYNSQQNVVPRRLFTRDDSIKDKDDTSLFTDNTLGLEITEILDRLTFLSDTLSLGNGSYVQ